MAEAGALRAELARLQDDVAEAARVGDLEDLRKRLDEAAPGSLGDRVDELAAGLARLAQRGDDAAAPAHDPQLDARITEAQVALNGLSERLGSLVDRIDGMQALGDGEQDLLKALEGRIATAVERAELDALAQGLEERLGAADEALRDLAGIRAELEARPTRDELASSVSEIAARLDELGTTADDGAADAVAASIADLAARIDALEPLTRAAAEGTDVDALASELRAGLEELRLRIVSGRRGRAGLLARRCRRGAPVEVGGSCRAVRRSPSSRSQLGARLDDVRSLVESSSVEGALVELRRVVDELASRADRAIERDELDGLQRRLEDLVDRTEIEGLTAQLGARLDEVRALVESSGDDERLASLVGAVEELRAQAEESVARPELATLASELRAGLEELRRRSDPTAQEDRITALVDGVAELRSYLGVVQDRLDGTVGRPDIDELAARLGARVDEVHSLVESSSVEDALVELRGVVEGLASRADRAVERDELDGLQRRLEALVERGEVEGLTAQLDARLDEVRALVESSGDDERLASLVAAVDGLRPQVEAAVARPELAELSARLEKELEELRRQIRAGGDDDRVTSLADSVSELRSYVSSMQSRLGGAVDRSEVDGLVEQFAARVDEVRVLVESSSVEDRVAPVEGAVAELRGWLGSVQGRLDGVAERSEVESLAAHLDAVRVRSGGCGRAAGGRCACG